MEETERLPVNFKILLSPLTVIRAISSSCSQFTFSEEECIFRQRMASWIPFRTCEHKICSHMGLGSSFRRVVGQGRDYDVLWALLVLSLQGVTKVRESQMSRELQALPLEKFAVEILPLYV